MNMTLIILRAIVFITAIIAIPRMAQINCGINDDYFRLVKIRRLSWLFNGVSGVSSKKHGVIYSFLILQILGYAFGLISTIVSIVWISLLREQSTYLLVYFGIVLAVECLVVIVVTEATRRVYFKREKHRKTPNV